jgi:hypothetical protein
MTMHRTTVGALTLAGAGMLAYFTACTGTISDPVVSNPNDQTGGSSSGAGTDSDSGSGSPGSGSTWVNAFPCTSTTPSSGPTPLLLLSRAQYLNTLQSLFGAVVPNLDSALGPDGSYQTTDGAVTQFGLIQADIDLTEVANYQTAAERVATAVVNDPTTLSAIVPCAAGTSKRTCAQTFVQSFSSLAYRAPVTDPADIARHMALYDAGATVSDAHGIELVLRGMLQSPRFLYRVEIGSGPSGGNVSKLSGYEVAARLSYVLWNTLPDAQLTQAAAAGLLETKAQVSAQLTRMLQDPKGQLLLRGFLEGMVQLPGLPSAVKDPVVYPAWTMAPTLPSSMQGQAQAFFDDVLRRQGGTLSALLTSSTVFVNKDLAPYYGMTGGATFQAVALPAGKASGLLTLPALLTLMAKPDEPWPIYRGKFVREMLLCQELPAPPPNVPKPPDVQAGISTRQRLSQHETNASCSGCHQIMDPIGFGFENYDGLGRLQTTDGNQPIDVRGNIGGGGLSLATDIDGPFNGVAELATKLAGSVQVQQCIARQWFRYAMSRYEQGPDNCSMKSIVDTFQTAHENLNVLPGALVQSDAFLYRSSH